MLHSVPKRALPKGTKFIVHSCVMWARGRVTVWSLGLDFLELRNKARNKRRVETGVGKVGRETRWFSGIIVHSML